MADGTPSLGESWVLWIRQEWQRGVVTAAVIVSRLRFPKGREDSPRLLAHVGSAGRACFQSGVCNRVDGVARRHGAEAAGLASVVVNAAEAMPFGGTAMANAYCRAGVLSQVARREEREWREFKAVFDSHKTHEL